MTNVSPMDDAHQGSDIDRVSLLAFKSEITHDPHGVLSNWNESVPHCQWYGVTCGAKVHRRVVALILVFEGLVGTLSPFVGNLTFLHYLQLTNNTFQGHIPTQIGQLHRLRYLNLELNTFTGLIPSNISRCSNLKFLGLSHNHLGGLIPPQLSLLSNLILFNIGHNMFRGNLFDIVANMTSLQTLEAVSNLLEGSIPQSVGQLRNLSNLSIAYNKISGHFGCVYKGILDPERTVVAVKVIKVEEEGASKSFLSECKALRNTRHRNLVKIVTVCSSTDFKRNDFKALVYEFMPNGNLEQWIHDDRNRGEDQGKTLSLEQRLNIAIDVGNALDYLHNDCENPIIHCDLKPSNILVDDQMVAHVGDFGLARFLSNSGTSITSSVFVKGTVGYAAPEYGLGSMVSKEGDVYSYGIVLIELMTAIKPTDSMFSEGLNLHEYAKLALPDQLPTIIDEILLRDNVGARHGIQYKYLECIQAVIETGLKCSAEPPQDRISMENAIGELRKIRDKFLCA